MTKAKTIARNVSQSKISDRYMDTMLQGSTIRDDEGDMEPAVLATVLAADYPLIDSSLIHAFLSDYDTASLSTHIEEIRDQLAILEATLVPDPDDPSPAFHPDPSTSSAPSSVADDIEFSKLKLHPAIESSSLNGESLARSSKLGPVAMSRSGTSTSGTTGTESTSLGDEEEFVDEQELLKALFPSLDTKTILEALNVSISLPAAIDHLLSVELINSVEREGIWPDDNLESDQEGWQLPSPIIGQNDGFIREGRTPITTPKSQPSRNRKRKKDHVTYPLVDTLQRQVTPVSSRPSSRSSSKSRTADSVPSAGPSSNTWYTMTSLAEYLSNLLPPTKPNHFLAFCHSPKYHSAYSAIRASLAALPSSSSSANITKKFDAEEDERSKSILEEIYGVSLLDGGHKMFQEDLEVCVDITGGDVATVMDLMDLLDEISHWPGDDEVDTGVDEKPNSTPVPSVGLAVKSTAMPPVSINTNRLTSRPVIQTTTTTERIVPGSRPPPGSISSPSTPSNPSRPPPTTAVHASKVAKHPGGIEHIQNWRTISHVRQPRRSAQLHPYASHIPSYARGTLPHDSTPGSLTFTSKPTGPSFDECLTRARNERQKREEAIRNAGKSYKTTIKGKKHGALVAGHYASQAREAQENAKLWELKAARMVVQHQLASGGNTIDLHHLTIHEGEILSLEVARSWFEGGVTGGGGGAGAMGKPLIIVTGVGRHSAGGRGVLGPAVANMLEGHGWRVDRGEGARGYLVVRGKR